MLSFCGRHILVSRRVGHGRGKEAYLDALLALEHFCHNIAQLVEVGESSSVDVQLLL